MHHLRNSLIGTAPEREDLLSQRREVLPYLCHILKYRATEAIQPCESPDDGQDLPSSLIGCPTLKARDLGYRSSVKRQPELAE